MLFVSKCYEGSYVIWHKSYVLVELSNLLEKLEPSDHIMADKGFQIQDLLKPLGVQLNMLLFPTGSAQMLASDAIVTKKIAHLCVHVEEQMDVWKNSIYFLVMWSMSQVHYQGRTTGTAGVVCPDHDSY